MKTLFARTVIALLILLLAAAGVWLGKHIGEDPGYVLFAFNGWSIETSLWFFLAALIIFIIVVYILWWIVHHLLISSSIFSQWLHHRSHQHAVERTNDGLLSFMAGLWKEASENLLKAAPAADMPVLNYIAAAHAAEKMGDTKKCDEALAKADEIAPHSFAVQLARADIQLNRGQLTQAGYELEQLRAGHPRHTQVLHLLQQVYYRQAQWAKLSQLLYPLNKYKVLPESEFEALERQTAQQLLLQIAHSDGSLDNKLLMINDAWRTFSSAQIHDPAVVATYAQCLMELNAENDAEVILKSCLKKQWNEQCVRLVAQLSGGDVNKRLVMAESWLRDHPRDPILLLTLGRLCLRNQLWGKARTYFQESLHLAHSAETYAELGRLCASLSEDELSASYFRQGLLMAQTLPDLPMPLLDSHKISPHLR